MKGTICSYFPVKKQNGIPLDLPGRPGDNNDFSKPTTEIGLD
jgi:hypothetical protein